ncbi:MAG TPA: carboxypeptidase-like regulatory domain-containing protein [Polyangiaceae bacterium]
MKHRSWAFTALALVPGIAYLTDAPTASAAPTLTCSTYPTCVSNLQNTHLADCAEARRENKNAACPPLSAQYIANVCGPAPNCAPITGTVRPKFLVTSIVYAPPGSANKGGGSNVDYGTSSTTGVTTSSGSSFKSSYGVKSSLSLSAGTGFNTSSLDVSVSASTSSSSENDNTLDVKKTTGFDLKVPGPQADGVDHDSDEIWVLLSPLVAVTAVGQSVQWEVGMDSRTVPQYATVAWLKNPSTMPANVAQAFAAAGCTAADFATMLARDPYASLAATATPDPTRYTLVDTFTYEANGDGPSQVYTLKNDTTVTTKTTNTDSYTLGVTITGSDSFLSFIKASLSLSSEWTWTDTSSSSNSQDNSQSASASVASPSPAYTTGATDIQVYWDGIYGTFLFVPYTASNPTLTGVVTLPTGQPAVSADVVVQVGSKRVHALTNRKGMYRVSGFPAGAAQVSYGGRTQAVTLGRATSKVDFAAAALRR